MDAGSFIFESVKNGKAVRWIEDPLPERYRHLLRMKLALDDYSDSSSRWSVGNMSVRQHAVCFLDDRPFATSAHVPLALDAGSVVADLSALFPDACDRVTRRLTPVGEGLELVDEFSGLHGEHRYTFNFTTFRKVALEGDKILFEDGALTLSASRPARGRLKTFRVPRTRFSSAGRAFTASRLHAPSPRASHFPSGDLGVPSFSNGAWQA